MCVYIHRSESIKYGLVCMFVCLRSERGRRCVKAGGAADAFPSPLGPAEGRARGSSCTGTPGAACPAPCPSTPAAPGPAPGPMSTPAAPGPAPSRPAAAACLPGDHKETGDYSDPSQT